MFEVLLMVGMFMAGMSQLIPEPVKVKGDKGA